MNYYEWREATLLCKHCGWSGLGKDTKLQEAFRELAEYGCPACSERIAVVAYPTTAEMRSSGPPGDRLLADVVDRGRDEWSRRALRSADQLPEIDGDNVVLTWDRVGRDIAISQGDRVVWRELGTWEESDRFREIAEILVARYGVRLADLVPTVDSFDALYGDRMGAPHAVDLVRKGIQEQRTIGTR